MTFKTKWFSNKIVNTEGYSIRTVGRGAILYENADQRVYVSAERLGGEGALSWALYPSEMRLGTEYGPMLGDEAFRRLIVERIKAAFDFMGWCLDVS